jgi:hypothetical protein
MKYQFFQNGTAKYQLDQKMGRPKNQFGQEMAWPNIYLTKKWDDQKINLTKKWYDQISTYPKWNGQTSMWSRKGMAKYLFIQNGTVKHQFDQEWYDQIKILPKMVWPNINLTKKRYNNSQTPTTSKIPTNTNYCAPTAKMTQDKLWSPQFRRRGSLDKDPLRNTNYVTLKQHTWTNHKEGKSTLTECPTLKKNYHSE